MTKTRKNVDSYAAHGDVQKVRARLKRIRAFASPGSGFANARSALVACVEEIDVLLPLLTDRLAVRQPVSDSGAQVDFAENRSQLRELNALLDSGRRLLEDAGPEDNTMAQALNAYLAACIDDMLEAYTPQTVGETNGD